MLYWGTRCRKFDPTDRRCASKVGGENRLWAISALDGAPKWNFTSRFGFGSTPLVDGAFVYALSFRMLYCLNRHNGTVVWELDIVTNRSDTATRACFVEGDLNDASGLSEEASPSRGLGDDVLITFQHCVIAVHTGPDANRDGVVDARDTSEEGVAARIRWKHTLTYEPMISSGVAVRRFLRASSAGREVEDAVYVVGAEDGQVRGAGARDRNVPCSSHECPHRLSRSTAMGSAAAVETVHGARARPCRTAQLSNRPLSCLVMTRS